MPAVVRVSLDHLRWIASGNCIAVETVDELLSLLMGMSRAPKLQHMPGLDFEQAALDRRGATQPPQRACQPEYQFSFDRRLRVIVSRDSHFEGGIVLGTFQRIDHGFCGKPMSDGILSGPFLAFFGDRTGAELRIATVGLDLTGGGHRASGP